MLLQMVTLTMYDDAQFIRWSWMVKDLKALSQISLYGGQNAG